MGKFKELVVEKLTGRSRQLSFDFDGPTELDLERMQTQAVLHEVEGVLSYVEEKLTLETVYGTQITRGMLEGVRERLKEIVDAFGVQVEEDL